MNILEETLAAYSDCNELSDQERNLDFRASDCVFVDEAIDIMGQALGGENSGYNNFEPNLLKFFKDKNVTLTLAREGSVCIYVNGLDQGEDINSYYLPLLADEVDWEGNALRVWWD